MAAVEVVRILLVMRQRSNQISEVRINKIRAGEHNLVGGYRMAEYGPQHINVSITKLKGVAIADLDHVLSGGLMRLQQVRHEFRLRLTLGADTRAIHRIVNAQQRAQMVHDHGEWQ